MRSAYHVAAVALLAVATALGAAAPPEAAPVIELPPAPVPPPVPQPVGARVKLGAGQAYDVRAKVPCVVRAYPAGLVSVETETVAAGETLRVREAFTDGAKSRTYRGPLTVYSVRAVGTGACELVVTPLGLKSETEIVTVALDVDAGQGPIPPPKPKPEPKPDPKPEPVKVESVWVIVVEDASAPRTLDTAKALNDPFWAGLKPKHSFRHYLSTAKPAIDNGYVEQGKRVGFPAVLILDAKDGDVLKAFTLGTVADLDAQVKAVVK